ncbi:hypothetical protein CDEST_13030 [Colletotrichum destructivum]|uniref:Uncharacterized protein n=1 Tax=Colletotrichum destructivum TaxID=34406 RepID=A0AAX4IXQ1_9PEZI|nr:hypothetical protein CDEST_13030 [Colletotrichum destructivum]
MAPAWLEKYITQHRTRDAAPSSLRWKCITPSSKATAGSWAYREGDRTSRYEVKRRAVLGVWGDKCDVTAPVDGDREVAVIDFHTFPLKTEIQFPQRNHEIVIKANEGHYESSGGLGRLHWKPTGMVAYGEASWELRDESDLVMSVAIDDNQLNGLICIWRDGLDQQTVEELVVVGISQVEDYKKLNRKAKISAVGAGTNAAWLVGGAV